MLLDPRDTKRRLLRPAGRAGHDAVQKASIDHGNGCHGMPGRVMTIDFRVKEDKADLTSERILDTYVYVCKHC
jgi:hypothetical protein